MWERAALRGLLPAPTSSDAAPPLTKAERIVLFSAAVAGAVVAAVSLIVEDTPASSLLQLVATAAFALFAWRPFVAMLALASVMVLSFPIGAELPLLLALTMATGCVVRTASDRLSVTYGAALLAAITLVTLTSGRLLTPFAVVTYIVIAAMSGGLGILLRRSALRGRRLELQVAASMREAEEAARVERIRIADDLHDVIAHDLVAIVMHAHVLESDPEESIRLESQAAIVDSAKKALSDIRRVVDTAEPALGAGASASSERALKDELVAARSLLIATGRPVSVLGEAVIDRLPRDTSVVFGRALRESVTNITKHGGDGPVELEVTIDDSQIRMQIRSELPTETSPAGLPSGGHGTARLRQRARLLGGEFSAGLVHGQWVATLTAPAPR